MILGYTWLNLLEYFLIYSFLGWCLEVAFHAVKAHIVVNRGFVNGPFCPIYGCGVIAMLLLVAVAEEKMGVKSISLPVLFVLGALFSTLIELIGGWGMEKLFHTHWWDYSNQKFNFHGYICLRFTILWGIGICVVLKIIHPFISGVTWLVATNELAYILVAVIYIMLAADIIVTAAVLIGLNKKLKEIDELRAQMRAFSDDLTVRIADSSMHAEEAVEGVAAMAEQTEEKVTGMVDAKIANAMGSAENRRNELVEQLNLRGKALRDHIVEHPTIEKRLMMAYPDMSANDFPDITEMLKDQLMEYRKERKAAKKK